jgi:metal-responsive CopG/Arc/MetJ family transcriptional regulator
MKRQTVITKKRRGPRPTGKGTLVGVRLQPHLLTPLDAWAAAQADEPGRSEAIRRLVELGLKAKAAKA